MSSSSRGDDDVPLPGGRFVRMPYWISGRLERLQRRLLHDDELATSCSCGSMFR
jgi:hypothetical protein